MRRREFIALAGGAALAPLPAAAQTSTRPRLVGFLGVAAASNNSHLVTAFMTGMREFGHAHPDDFRMAFEHADGDPARLPELAGKLVRLGPDVIVTGANISARAVKETTSTLPIVCFGLADPVGQGWAASDARPTSNVTGLLFNIATLPGKLFQFARELLPQARTLADLYQDGLESYARQLDADATALGFERLALQVSSPDGLAAAFEHLSRARAEVVIVKGDPLFFSERQRIAALAAQARLPLVSGLREAAEAGALLAYGTNLQESARGAAYYVDRIFKGAQPADLPIQLPTKLDLIINLRTARALGLTIPPTLLARADEVIE